MEKYLTAKSMPRKRTVLLEVVVMLAASLATLLWISVGLYGLVADGLVVAHLMVLLCALPWVLGLIWVLRRWFARRRARRIVRLLCASERGAMSWSQLSRVGIYSPEKTVVKLNARKYLRNVVSVDGEVRLKEGQQQEVCSYCGAALRLHKEGADVCPGCGASTIKYL